MVPRLRPDSVLVWHCYNQFFDLNKILKISRLQWNNFIDLGGWATWEITEQLQFSVELIFEKKFSGSGYSLQSLSC